MATYKTPDVYIEEIPVFPPSVAEVETAIPAFIGYTEKAMRNAPDDLKLKPTKIYSFKEYEQYFGNPKDDEIQVTVTGSSTDGFRATFNELSLKSSLKYLMYYSVKMFFDNGGGQCYIVSASNYESANTINLTALRDGLDVLEQEDEPTLIVIPEAVKLSTSSDYASLVQAVLAQCNKLKDRFAIFDLYNGDSKLDAPSSDPSDPSKTYLISNREHFGSNHLKYGAVYYPFLKTTMNLYVNKEETNVKVAPPFSGVPATVAAATIANGVVTNITVAIPGSGYTADPLIDIATPPAGGTKAEAKATRTGGKVSKITIVNGGSGYTTAPSITVADPPAGGTKAEAKATIADGVVTNIPIQTQGSGYVSAPQIIVPKPPALGELATAKATIANGVVTNIIVAIPGSGYTADPLIDIATPPAGGIKAEATATRTDGKVSKIAIVNGGSGYTTAPSITVADPPAGGTKAEAKATIADGVVTNIQVTKGGSSYTTPPAIQITPPAEANLSIFEVENTALYNFVKSILKEHFVVLPPSGAIAGIYAATDSNRGVWKAPANVSLTNVIEPVIKLNNDRQDSLNVDPTTGKSINAIRSFMGKGTLVWGARTLAGNDNEWRYISVRRFFSVVEESVKKSTYWAVFEPNDANTWVKVRGMIENYLTQKWREGALAGATPKEAFFVKCGLGTTMTAQDILEGRMNVEIGMAVVRPAEFIILKFSHKLQTS